jgi:hypothetical protein
LKNYFENDQDQYALDLKDELIEAMSEDCSVRNIIFEKA